MASLERKIKRAKRKETLRLLEDMILSDATVSGITTILPDGPITHVKRDTSDML